LSVPAILALEDGELFYGTSVGVAGRSHGEVVFNTAMTGYQEIATDPSYAGQLVTLTYPHIGNVGTNDADAESGGAQLEGLIIREATLTVSSWRSERSLEDYLNAEGVVAIADVDTRRLTRRLRDGGAQNGCIVAGAGADPEQALAGARAAPRMEGQDLASAVTTPERYTWTTPAWRAPDDPGAGEERPQGRFEVVAYDFGIKRNILRVLADHGCRVTVVPARTPAAEVLALDPDGVFLSNGPGDPEPCDYAIEAITELLASGVPIFGICLGHQLLALACGARTVKMKFGHHGANHPVVDLDSGQVLISSQNHGFAVDEASLPGELRATHRSLFDGSLQGIAHRERAVFGFQGHPEASPGPHDVRPLFTGFTAMMARAKEAVGGGNMR